jgi:hypothetical protein
MTQTLSDFRKKGLEKSQLAISAQQFNIHFASYAGATT